MFYLRKFLCSVKALINECFDCVQICIFIINQDADYLITVPLHHNKQSARSFEKRLPYACILMDTFCILCLSVHLSYTFYHIIPDTLYHILHNLRPL